MRNRVCGLVVACVALGCGGKDGDSSKKAPPSPPRDAARAATKPKRAVPPPRIEEAALVKLVDAWLASQNTGDFNAYQALYADKFDGVLRTGKRVRRMKRKAWLASRKRMFKSKMTVTADKRTFSRRTSHSAQVDFVQTWSTTRYKDTGPKRLLVVRQGKDLKIAEEQMLESRVEVPPLDPDQFAFVRDGFAVLTQQGKDEWGTGKLSMSGDGVKVVERAVKQSALPKDLQKWKTGRVITVHGHNGKTCRGKISALGLQVGTYPHFSTEETWKDMSDASIAAEIWTDESKWLTATFEQEKGPCDEALFITAGVTKSQFHPTPLAPIERDALVKLAVARYRGLATYKQQQRQSGEKAPWDKVREDAVIRGPGGKLYVAISGKASDAPAGCGVEAFHAVFRARPVAGSYKLTLLSNPSNHYSFFVPTAVIDINGDGVVEMLDTHTMYRKVRGKPYEFTDDIRYPNEGACY